MNIVLLGPPGAGKGTQADILSGYFTIPTISTGVIIRNAIREGSDLGKTAEGYIDAGQLVPDDVVVNIIKERLAQQDCQNGFILDGFPRTLEQASTLDKIYDINKALCLEVSDEDIIMRLGGRRECVACGASYHIVYNKPKLEKVCDKCGGELISREDDDIETIKKRIKVYHERTEPIKEYYRKQNKLALAKGCELVEDTTKQVFIALGIKE